jgi:hypothetical protein
MAQRVSVNNFLISYLLAIKIALQHERGESEAKDSGFLIRLPNNVMHCAPSRPLRDSFDQDEADTSDVSTHTSNNSFIHDLTLLPWSS